MFKFINQMAKQDDTPIQSGSVTVRHAFSKDPADFVETVHEIPTSGIVTLEFFPPLDEEVLNLALEAQYKNLTQWLADLTRSQSPSNTFLQATLLTQNPQASTINCAYIEKKLYNYLNFTLRA